MNKLRLAYPLPPSVNHYLAYRAIIKNGKPLAVSYNTPASVKYKREFSKYVNDEVNKQGWDLEPDKARHFYVDGYFYFPQIDMDANNYWKVPLDAITDTKRIWLDDNVVCERVQAIRYDADDPHVELVIYPVSYIGVFDSASQLEEFTRSNCIGCTRYKRNCSLLRRAKEGRIQSEIHDGICEKNKNKRSISDGKEDGDCFSEFTGDPE